MSIFPGGSIALIPSEAVAREKTLEQSHARHVHQERRPHVRVALVLRRLAERLDPAVARTPAVADPHPSDAALPHAGAPRPWAAAPRRAPHRHS